MTMPKAKKTVHKLPKFETGEDERQFWAKHDSADHINWRSARRLKLVKLRPTTRTISIRLPETMIERLKVLANKRDMPYQSLLKRYVAERLEEEIRPGGHLAGN